MLRKDTKYCVAAIKCCGLVCSSDYDAVDVGSPEAFFAFMRDSGEDCEENRCIREWAEALEQKKAEENAAGWTWAKNTVQSLAEMIYRSSLLTAQSETHPLLWRCSSCLSADCLLPQ